MPVRFVIGLALFAAVLGTSIVQADETVVVTPGDLALDAESWYFYDDTLSTPSTVESPPHYEFTVGPEDPPLGIGSVSFELTDTPPNQRWSIATSQFAGTLLSDISTLSFDMYTPSDSTGGTGVTLFLNIDVDFDSTFESGDYQGRLVYLPQDNGSPSLDTWETWDAFAGEALWGWSRYAGNGDVWPDGETSELRTLDNILTAFPNISVWNDPGPGQIVIRAGHPGPDGLKGSVDNVVVGETTFDFEPVVAPTTKDDCKQGGWAQFNSPVFKNQGDCIQFVNTGN